MKKVCYFLILVLNLHIIALSAIAEAPILKSATFDANGRLHVKAKHPGEAGCYFSIVGGTSADTINTVIKSITVTEAQANADKVSIKTEKKYYCKQRSLYIQLEVVCLGDQISDQLSNVVLVKVPKGNLKK